MMNQVPYRVLLPSRIWEEAHDKKEFLQLVLDYMKRYPDYKVIKIENRFAICERK